MLTYLQGALVTGLKNHSKEFRREQKMTLKVACILSSGPVLSVVPHSLGTRLTSTCLSPTMSILSTTQCTLKVCLFVCLFVFLYHYFLYDLPG